MIRDNFNYRECSSAAETWFRRGLAAGLGFALLFATPARSIAPATPTASAAWVWAGIPLDSRSQGYQVLYLHQGEVGEREGRRYFTRQGLFPHPLQGGKELVLVLRVTALPDPGYALNPLLDRVGHWRTHGNRVRGVQFDFDSATAKLGRYAEWLAKVRTKLPSDLSLSVTGLADWSTQGDPRELKAIAGSVDEVVFQLYRGRAPIRDLSAYLRKLVRLEIPFRLGVLPTMELRSQSLKELKANPAFRGVLVFLEKDKS